MSEDREITITLRGRNLTQDGFDEARRKLLDLDDAAKRPKANVDGLGLSWKSLTGSFLAANLIERGAGALLSLGTEALDTAGNLVDLKNSTGASLEALQRWTHVAEQGGIPLERLTASAFKLGAAIAEGKDSTRSAVDRLGIAFDELRAKSPEDQFDAVMVASGNLGTEQERNAVLVELFGAKAAVELAKVVADYDKVAAAAAVAGDRQIEALSRAGDRIDQFGRDLKTGTVEVSGGILDYFYTTVEGLEQLTLEERRHYNMLLEIGGDAYGYLRDIAEERNAIEEQGPPLLEATTEAQADYVAQLAAAQEEMQGLTATQRAQIDAAQRLGASTKEIGEETGVTDRAIRLYNESLKQAAERKRDAEAASKKLADQKKKEREELEKLLTAWSNYGATLAPFTGLLERMETEARDHVTLVSMTTGEYAQASAAAQAWAETNGAVLAPSITAVTSTLETEGPKITGLFTSIAEGLPNIIMGAIQGGGSVLTAAGSFVGQSVGESAAKRWGGLITEALPFGLGSAVTAMLPLVGQLLGPLLNKIGGFFRNLFGGPSGDELAGRDLVAKFEGNIAKMLTDAQKMEAGTDGWKQTVIGLRDAYLAAGLTEQEALRDAERLWASSKDGAEASARVIAEIEAKMRAAGTAAAAGIDKIGDALEDLPDVIDIEIRGNYRAPTIPDGEGRRYAEGTKGVRGTWFPSFSAGEWVQVDPNEAIVPHRKVGEFIRDMIGAPAAGAGSGPEIHLHIGVDPKAGTFRVLGNDERHQVQQWLSSGQLMVPARAVVAR